MSSTDRATFAERWRSAVGAGGSDRTFLVWEGSGELVTTWSYAEFDAVVDEVATRLRELDAGPGRPVHVALANSPAFVAVWLGAARLGAVLVPVDPKASERELRESIDRTGPAVGVCAIDRAPEYRAAATGGPHVVEIDEDACDFEGLRGSGRSASITAPEPTSPLAIMFTSGTTSAPKGVVVTQANYAFAGDVMAAAAGLSAEDRQLVVLPMFHANAQYYSFAAAISVGASVALMSTFSATRFLEQAVRHDASHASLFAAPMRMILARGADASAGCRLRHVWFAQNVSDDQYEELSSLLGCRPRQLYGMTETIPAVLTNRATDNVPAAMGVPTLGCQVELRAVEGTEPVADGEVGEVVVGGVPGITLFDGYLDDPVTTKAAFDDRGWFRTGDLARRDGAGRFYFEGRSGDVLKVAGENVSIVEVEAVLSGHPGVFEAAVVGVPDPVRDEVPVAFVVRAPGGHVDELELDEYLASRLAPSKRPRTLHFVEELPRTSVGKIRKFMLRAQATAEGDKARGRR